MKKLYVTIVFTDNTKPLSFSVMEDEIQKDTFGMIFHMHKLTDPDKTKDILVPWNVINRIIIDEVTENDSGDDI